MGFASKIANSQNPPANMSANKPGVYGGAPPTGYTGGPPAALQPGAGAAGNSGYQQQQQQQPQQSQQQQYQPYQGSPAPPGGLGPSYPPQNAPYPGAPGRTPQQGPPSGLPGAAYGAPGRGTPAPPATEQQVAAYRQLLIGTIQEKRLQSFWPPDRLDKLVQSLSVEAPGKVSRLMHELAVPQEVAMDIMKLSLFDVILYVDDSGSIEFEERGVRKEQLKQIIEIVASAASTFDDDGISVRFMNNAEQGDGIRNADDVSRLVSRVRFQGLTPLGTGLRNKVLDPMVVGPARTGRLQKPVLIITITDGQPAGEPLDSVSTSIGYAVNEVSRTQYGQGAVSFQFSQVGNDTKARDFLSALDEDPVIGGLVDCTSNFEVEQDEMSRALPPVYLTRELWCAKLMLGSIDSSYDTKDEKAAGAGQGGVPPSGGPPAGQYGGYSQPSYGNQPPAMGYGAPQPASYGSGPGYSQSAYPPSQGQAPAPGYGQAQGQGQAPAPGYGQGQTRGQAPGYGQGYGQGYGAQSPHPSQPGYGQSSAGATRGYSPYGAPSAPPRY
ncbi:hypothetical protein BO71DRAFT_396764 [Aspergillus ellipticus CBS 707.79]|uniref:VWFA domain-containing protein n=1 Tax=Aspergillus ellipticus CBS 707.79 TaxID=1448320 RepID=A0A319DRV4_9EURO|nr:hypothetical protein BO71DRAFT_396764 [Aspergillus ellipticus CBS 707.79]